MTRPHALGTLALSLVASIVPSGGAPLLACSALSLAAGGAWAQSTSSDDAAIRRAKRDTLTALSTPVTLDVTDQPIEDIFRFLVEVTGAQIEPVYLTDNLTSAGIDPETPITIKVTQTPALTVLERVLLRAQRIEAPGDEYTWQFTDIGSVECGPKLELNRNQRVELYDIADLLFVVPDFDNAPEFDLQSAVQAAGGGGGGGGGQSAISGGGQDVTLPTSADRAKAITDLIESTIEPDQWADIGGDGASLTFFGTSIVVTAPDYIHRQIVGYSFWPSRLQQVRKVDGKQVIQIKPDRSGHSEP